MAIEPEPDELAIDWREYAAEVDEELADFERHIWPIFQRHGISKDMALLLHVISLYKRLEKEE